MALAVVSWLGFFAMIVVVALVVRIVERDGNRFARWHAAEALNLQLTLAVVWNLLAAPVLVAAIATPAPSDAPPDWFFLLVPVGVLLFFGCAATCVYGAVRAGRGDWWRCPFAVPFLRRHRHDRAAGLTAAGWR